MAIDGDTVRLSEQWKYRLGCEMPAGRGGVSFQNIPTGMYNSMISPLRNLTFKELCGIKANRMQDVRVNMKLY